MQHCDRLVVAVPWKLQSAFARYTMARNPEGLLLEKPVGVNPQEVPHGTLPFVGYNRRFYEPVQRLKARGTGGLLSVRCVISEWLDHHIAQTGRNVLPHLMEFTSCHTLDLLLYLLGPLNPMYLKSKPTLHINGFMTTQHGIPVHLSINQDDPQPVGLWFQYENECWALSPLETLNIYRGIQITDDGQHRAYTPRLMETVECDRTYKPGVLAQMRAFLSDDRSIAAGLDDQRNVLNLIAKLKGCSG